MQPVIIEKIERIPEHSDQSDCQVYLYMDNFGHIEFRGRFKNMDQAIYHMYTVFQDFGISSRKFTIVDNKA
jgi:hypothetical protein